MLELLLRLTSVFLQVLDNCIACARLILYHTLVCVRNARKLFQLLVRGTQTWVIMLFRLVMFTMVLAPGWYSLLKYFFFSPYILRNVEYGLGSKFRNVMDVYLPPPPQSSFHQHPNSHHPYPIIIFVSGGAWTIGYKLWSALVGRGLSALGYLVVVPDYRNFPQGDIEDMVLDIKRSVIWVLAHAPRFNGDITKITLAGQSAGAHICLCLLLKEYLQMKGLEEEDVEEEAAAALGEGSEGGWGGYVHLPLQPLHLLNPSPTSFSSNNNTPVYVEVSTPSPHAKSGHGHTGMKAPATPGLEKWITPLSSNSRPNNSPPFSLPDPGHGGEDVWREIFTPHASAHSSTATKRRKCSGAGLDVEGEVDGHTAVFSPENEGEEDATTPSPPHPPLVDTPPARPVSPSPHTPHSSQTAHPSSPSSLPNILPHISLYIGVSGPYNLLALKTHLHSRGLDSSILHWICRGQEGKYSPSVQLAEVGERLRKKGKLGGEEVGDVLADFPPVMLFHGSLDRSIPPSISHELHHTLVSQGGRGGYALYGGWSHTDPILEAPLMGDGRLFQDIHRAIHTWTSKSAMGVSASIEKDMVMIAGKEDSTDKSGESWCMEGSRFHAHEFSPLVPQFFRTDSKEGKEGKEEKWGQPLAPRSIVKFARLINPF